MKIQNIVFPMLFGLTLSSISQAEITMKSSDGSVEHLQKELLALQTKAGLLGFAKNQYDLGMAYYEGKLVPKNPSKAVEWLSKAANKNYAPAMFILGKILLSGDGVQQNTVLANQFLQAAASKGNSDALALIKEQNQVRSSPVITQQMNQKSQNTNGMCSYQDFYILSAGDIEYAKQSGRKVKSSEEYVKGACQIKINYHPNNKVEIYAYLRANQQNYPAYIVTQLNKSCDNAPCGMSISTGKHQLTDYDSIREYDAKGRALDPELEHIDNFLKEKIKPNQSYCFQSMFAHSGTMFCFNLEGQTVYQNARALE